MCHTNRGNCARNPSGAGYFHVGNGHYNAGHLFRNHNE
jgi:hypothetical protein